MKIAVITGASSGLGKEYASAVLGSRDNIDEIWVIARRADRLNLLREALGEKIKPFPLDITASSAIDEYIAALKQGHAEVALLINNAGFGKLGDFVDSATQENADMIRLNCEALTTFTLATLPFMAAGGEIINSCSIASFAPNARMAVYSSTKAYVMSFSRALRFELKSRKINSLAVCPGPMDTEFLSVANINKGASRTFDTLPRVNPTFIAKKSLHASKKRKAVYTCRVFYKFYRLLAKLLPHSIVMHFCKT